MLDNPYIEPINQLLNNREILLFGEINTQNAQRVISQLLYLENEDNTQDITIYINSPGGSVTDGLAIIDIMNYIKADVSTICVGSCASMGAIILTSGTPGKRYILKNSEVMIHQPLGELSGQCTDMEIRVSKMKELKLRTAEILAQTSQQDINKVLEDIERDYYMDASTAVRYGIVDKIV